MTAATHPTGAEEAVVKPLERRQKRSFFSRKKETKSVYDESLFKAILRTFVDRICLAGLLKLCGGTFGSPQQVKCHRITNTDTLKTTTPLLNKVLLTWLTQSYVWARANDEQRAALGLKQPRGIGYGIGLAVALFVMQGKSVSPLSLCAPDFLPRGGKFSEYQVFIPLKLNLIPGVQMNNHYMQSTSRECHPIGHSLTLRLASMTNGLLVRSGASPFFGAFRAGR